MAWTLRPSPPENLGNNLRGYWLMDQNPPSTTYVDQDLSGNHVLIRTNGASPAVSLVGGPGWPGMAGSWRVWGSGSNLSGIRLSNLATRDPSANQSISLWLMEEETTVANHIFSSHHTAGAANAVATQSNVGAWQGINAAASWVTFGGLSNIGTNWRHLVYCRQGGTQWAYLDNVLSANMGAATAANQFFPRWLGAWLAMATDVAPSTSNMRGRYCNVIMWDDVLNPTQVGRLFNEPLCMLQGGEEPPPVGVTVNVAVMA